MLSEKLNEMHISDEKVKRANVGNLKRLRDMKEYREKNKEKIKEKENATRRPNQR